MHDRENGLEGGALIAVRNNLVCYQINLNPVYIEAPSVNSVAVKILTVNSAFVCICVHIPPVIKMEDSQDLDDYP